MRLSTLTPLAPFIGTWTVEPMSDQGLAIDLRGTTSFAWTAERRFLHQRWEVSHPDAPDGLAVIGPGDGRDAPYLQHYFDARGVARVYEMSFDGDVWRLWRTVPDFSPLAFHQRFAGWFSADGATIEGRWERSQDDGASWRTDFDLRYSKLS